MQLNNFDDRNINWITLDWLPHLSLHVYNIDETNGIVDLIAKFAANKQILLHQHKAPYVTIVLQGELRIYLSNGDLKEIRPVGSYVATAANGEPHREGGGDQEAIVLFSNRNVTDAMYTFLDDDLKPIVTLGVPDFKALIAGESK